MAKVTYVLPRGLHAIVKGVFLSFKCSQIQMLILSTFGSSWIMFQRFMDTDANFVYI